MSSSYSSATSHQQLTLLCSKCDTACSVADSVPNGAKSFASRMHLDCKAIYRSHMARMKTHDKLKSWWAQTSEAEKKEWFRKQRQASQSSGRGHTRTFDDYQFEEWQEKMVTREQAANIDWVPFSKYETHWLIRQKSSSWIAAEWERLLKDPATGAKKIMGHWCVPQFAGGQCSLKEVERTVQRSGRAKSIADSNSLSTLQDEANISLASASDQIQREAMSEVGSFALSDHHVPDAWAQTPMIETSMPSFHKRLHTDIKRRAMAIEDEELDFARFLESLPDVQPEPKSSKPEKSIESKRLDANQTCTRIGQAIKNVVAQLGQTMREHQTCLMEVAVADDDVGNIAKRDKIIQAMTDAHTHLLQSATQLLDEKIKLERTDQLSTAEQFHAYKHELQSAAAEFRKSRHIAALRDAIGHGIRMAKDVKRLLQKPAKKKTPAPVLSKTARGAADLLVEMHAADAKAFQRVKSAADDIFSDDAGACVLHISAMTQYIEQIMADDFYNKQKKWVLKEMAAKSMPSTQVDIIKPAFEKQLQQFLQHLPQLVTSKIKTTGEAKERHNI